MKLTLTAAIIATTALALSACGGDDNHLPDGGGNAPTTDENFHETPVADETAPESGVFGSYEDPLPVGTPLTLASWELTISGDVTTGKGAAGAPDDEINLIAEASAIRIDPEQGTFSGMEMGSLRVSVIGGDGVEYTGSVYCPEMIDGQVDVYPGAELTGNLCPTLPTDAIPGSVWKVEQVDVDDVAYVETGM